jgi:hypothetical protein
MRCFIKIMQSDETVAFKGTITLNPGHSYLSQFRIHGALATVEIMARREGDVPDILDELEGVARVAKAGTVLDTIKQMRQSFNEVPITGAVKNPEVELLKLQMEDWRVGHTNLKGHLEDLKGRLEQIYKMAEKALDTPTPPVKALEEIMTKTGYIPPGGL